MGILLAAVRQEYALDAQTYALIIPSGRWGAKSGPGQAQSLRKMQPHFDKSGLNWYDVIANDFISSQNFSGKGLLF